MHNIPTAITETDVCTAVLTRTYIVMEPV